jgi:hypothetical protein
MGGCSSMGDVEKTVETQTEIPETIAAQDEYTRSFLLSTDEVSEGHYAFKTWTEAYTMWIPVDAKFAQTYYEKKEKHFERFSFSWVEEGANLSFLVFGLFEDRVESEEIGLNHFSFDSQYEGDFERFEEEDKIYYHAKEVIGVEKDKSEAIVYLAFIKHKNSDKSLGVHYEVNCSDWTPNCDADSERIKNHFWELVKSVKFAE